jgi:hypothetical protein
VLESEAHVNSKAEYDFMHYVSSFKQIIYLDHRGGVLFIYRLRSRVPWSAKELRVHSAESEAVVPCFSMPNLDFPRHC